MSSQSTTTTTYEGLITCLQPNQIFVFGSNPEGRHGRGAAKTAWKKFGARYNQGRGRQGNSYGLVTKNLAPNYFEEASEILYRRIGPKSLSPRQIRNNIAELYEYARAHADLEFMVAYSADAQNLNGYSSCDLAGMFAEAAAGDIPPNMVFEKGFAALIRDLAKRTQYS